MCNLYSITTNQAAIIALFRVINRYVGNLPPMPGVFPDYPAPVVRYAAGERELTIMRWGMPPPPRAGSFPVTNIRNTTSPHWRGWLKPENRCLVPANSFAEYAPEPNPETKKKDVVSAVSEQFSELIGCPISKSLTTCCVCLELRSLPSTGVTRLQLRTSPPPQGARPVPRGRSVGRR